MPIRRSIRPTVARDYWLTRIRAQAYDLTLAGIDAERADGGDLTCEHCDRVIRPDEPYHLHTIGGAPRPVCGACDAREPE